MRALIPMIALLAAGCAATPADTARMAEREAGDQQRLATALAGLTPGKPVDCLSLSLIPSTRTTAFGRTILYQVSRGLAYRSDTSGGCEHIGQGDILVTKTPSGQLCRGDIATTVDSTSHFFTGSCSFGAFIPYRQAR